MTVPGRHVVLDRDCNHRVRVVPDRGCVPQEFGELRPREAADVPRRVGVLPLARMPPCLTGAATRLLRIAERPQHKGQE